MAAETFRIEIPIEVEDKTEPGVSQAQKKLSAFDKANQKTQERLEKMNKTKFQMVISAMDKASGIIGAVGSKVKSLTGRAWSVAVKAVDMATAPIRGIIDLFANPLFALGATIGISVGVGQSITIFKDFEQSMANAGATAGATGDELQAMTDLAKQLGADTRFSASEAADSMYYMASAGWKLTDMQAGLTNVLQLSAATQNDLAETANQVISALNMFELQAGDTARVADVYTMAIGNSQATMEKLAYSMRYVGPVANSLNYTLEESTAALAMLYDKGFEGEQAGTVMRSALSSLLDPTTEMVQVLKELGLTTNDVNPAANKLVDIVGKLERAEIDTAQATRLFGTEAGPGMIALIGKGSGALKSFTELLEGSGGNAEKMAAIMNDTLANSFDELSSKIEDVEIAFGERLKPHLESFTSWLGGKAGSMKSVVGSVMDWVDSKIVKLQGTIAEFTSSDAWASADLWGKIAIAWDKIVAEPFDNWWNSTGRAWLSEKAGDIGKGMGNGLTAGLLGLLGIDLSGAAADGQNLGASFVEGFKTGFDTEKITAALKEWAGDHKGGIALAGLFAGRKFIGGLAGGIFEQLKKRANVGSNAAPGGAVEQMGSAFRGATTQTMTVSAGVVNVYGPTTQGMANAAGNALRGLPGGGAQMALPGGAAQLALPGAGGAAAAGKTLIGTAPGGAVGAGLAGVGTALGSGATTAAGAALAGGGAVLGGIGGLVGIGSGIVDIVHGAQATDAKEQKDSFVTGGTKIGMVGAGAAAGAAIGSVIPVAGTAVGALVGAGVGGAGALLAGSPVGKWLSDMTDEGGPINVFFTETLPEFFTETIPEAAGAVGDAIGSFFTETVPGAFGDLCDGVGRFFTEQVPYAVGYAAAKVGAFFSEDVPRFFGDLCNDIGNFFTTTLPTWASDTWNNKIVPFFTEDIPGLFGGLWDGISTFFTTDLPTWGSDIWNNKIVPFFTKSIPDFFGQLWDGVVNTFTVELPNIAKGVWDSMSGFFTKTIPDFLGGIWKGATDFFAGVGETVSGAFDQGYSDATGGSAVTPHAWGGIMTRPHMGLVAEAGAESIIPLTPSKRTRGIDLWQQTGRMLGVQPYADGGIVGEPTDNEPVPVPVGNSGGGGGYPVVHLQVALAPEIKIQVEGGADEERIVAVLKARIKEMVDDISDELADQLARVFSNMPKGVKA